jgi:hypothetical protein
VFSKVGTTAAPFLKISVGRATGMGDAFTAVSDDASAAYFNPAGLALIGKRLVMVNHIAWIAGTNHEFITGVLPVSGVGSFSLAITSFNAGTIEQTLIDNPSTPAREDDGTGVYFGGTNMAIALIYSRLITEKLAFGLCAKSVTEGIWSMSSSGIGADLGLLYNTGWRSLRLGASVANFGTDLSFSGLNLEFTDSSRTVKPPASYKTNPAPLPITFRFGLAYNILDDSMNRLTADVDLVHPSDINETVNLGFEYALAKHYFIRTGYILNTDIQYARDVGWNQGISAGAGLAFTPVKGLDMTLDYGYRNQGYLGGTHRVALSVAF